MTSIEEGNIEQNKDTKNEYDNKNNNENLKKSSLERDDNIEVLQLSIQRISKKIEEDKINLRILQERFIKKQSEYNQFAGKPIIKTKEQKFEEMKEKLHRLRNHQIFDPNYGKKEPVLQPGDETKKIQKNTDKCKIELDNLIDSINKQMLYNSKLSKEIEEIRKEKVRICEKFEKNEEQNKKMSEELEYLTKRSSRIFNKIPFQELNKVKEKGKTIEVNFLDKRDCLEAKYHKVIEANIRREKDHKNELRKIRLKNAIFADKARKKGGNRSMTTNGIKIEDSDELHDRIPILDLLIEKWKFITKYKKTMMDKYIKYANEIKTSFTKLLEYLGIEKLELLPDIYVKNEKQMSRIESYLSSITSEVDSLTQRKEMLEKQIVILTQTKDSDNEGKINLLEDNKAKIEILKRYNDELIRNINIKRRIFREMEKPTFDFLKKMEKTYLTDFIVNKNNVEDTLKLSENNVITFLGTVYCYCQLIRDFDENVKNTQADSMQQESNDINRTIDLLQKDIKTKLSKMNINNCVNSNIHSSINNVVKHGNDFDVTIRRLANIIVGQVNNSGDYSLNNFSSMNTNNASS